MPTALRNSAADLVTMGFTENISQGGFRLVCRKCGSLPVRETLSARISLVNEQGVVVTEHKHTCRVVYVQKREDGKLAVGLEFIDDEPDDAA